MKLIRLISNTGSDTYECTDRQADRAIADHRSDPKRLFSVTVEHRGGSVTHSSKNVVDVREVRDGGR